MKSALNDYSQAKEEKRAIRGIPLIYNDLEREILQLQKSVVLLTERLEPFLLPAAAEGASKKLTEIAHQSSFTESLGRLLTLTEDTYSAVVNLTNRIDN
jgi:hypothetical protein